jgi:hypothetical protein
LAGEAAGAWPLVPRAPPRVPARVLVLERVCTALLDRTIVRLRAPRAEVFRVLLRTVVRLDGWR